MTAATIWISGLFLQSGMALLSFGEEGSGRRDRWIANVNRWGLLVTGTAMVVTWVLGVRLALSGGWLGSPWLDAKLALVVLLTLLYVAQALVLRRPASAPQARRAPILALSPAFTLIAVLAIVGLAWKKPF
jgi:uncharacterized membrane protein